LLGRRRRAGDIDSRNEQQAVAALERQIRVGLIEVFPLEDAHARAAIDLLAEKPQFALRTLDALHLALALALRVRTLATSDQLVAEAAGSLGLEVEVFL
jgi:predicted nucleic acid-binding protein